MHPAGVLLGPQRPDHRDRDRAPVILYAHGAGGEPHPARITPPGFESREAHPPAFAGPVLASFPISQALGQIGQPRRVALLGILGPPRRHVIFGSVPRPSQRLQVPVHRLMCRISGFGVEVGLHLGQAPVESFAAGAEM